MSSPFLILTDLDNSLFQSHRSDSRGIYPMAVDRDGANHSFARKDQRDLFYAMKQIGNIVPVTARSHQQMERVTGWDTGQLYDLALTDLGATLLVRDNLGDAKWQAIEEWSAQYITVIEERTDQLAHDFQLLRDTHLPQAGLSDQVSVELVALGKLNLPLYFALVVQNSDSDLVELVTERFAKPMVSMSGNYRLHVTGNVIALWPNFVSKGQAVARLLDLVEQGTDNPLLKAAFDALDLKGRSIITMGDNITDVEFMVHGDIVMAPKRSEIVSHLDHKAHEMMMNRR